jgi:hypothetical protein
MVGTLTTIRTDRTPVVLWTPWGAIPKAASQGRQTKARTKLYNAIESARRPDGKDITHIKIG